MKKLFVALSALLVSVLILADEACARGGGGGFRGHATVGQFRAAALSRAWRFGTLGQAEAAFGRLNARAFARGSHAIGTNRMQAHAFGGGFNMDAAAMDHVVRPAVMHLGQARHGSHRFGLWRHNGVAPSFEEAVPYLNEYGDDDSAGDGALPADGPILSAFRVCDVQRFAVPTLHGPGQVRVTRCKLVVSKLN